MPPRGRIWYPGGATLGSSNLSTSLPIAKPATVVDNTLLLAVMGCNSTQTFNVGSTGFQTTLGAGSNTSSGFGVFWKFIPVAASEAASSYSFGVSGLPNNRGFIIPYLGCDPSSPIEEIVRGTPGSGTPQSPTITPDQTGLTLLSIMQMISGGVGQTVPAGMTQDFLDTTASAVRGSAREVLGPASATGTRTWGVSGNHGAAAVLLRPAA